MELPVEIEVSVDAPAFDDLVALLSELPGEDVELRDVEPSDPVLRASSWHSVVIAVASAGGLKAVKDVLVAYVESRRVSLTVKRTGSAVSVSVEGPVTKVDEVRALVDTITAP